MADSAKLYLNPQKWNKDDAVDLVHTTVNDLFGHTELPQIKCDTSGYGKNVFMYYLLKKGPGMVFITHSHLGGIPALMIDISANREKTTKFLQKIAEKVGGMYLKREGDDAPFVEFQDPFCENEDFMLKQIQKRGTFYDVKADRLNQEIDQMIENLQKMKKPEPSEG